MKRVIKGVAIACAIAAATAATALAAGGPSGTYKTTISGDKALGGHLNGTWKIKFKNGTYKVSDNGHAVVHGTYTISGRKIALTDTGGQSKCSGTGTYKFKLSGSTLTFKKVTDKSASCAGRVAVLSHTFTKVS